MLSRGPFRLESKMVVVRRNMIDRIAIRSGAPSQASALKIGTPACRRVGGVNRCDLGLCLFAADMVLTQTEPAL
jgi:hypothetical protein